MPSFCLHIHFLRHKLVICYFCCWENIVLRCAILSLMGCIAAAFCAWGAETASNSRSQTHNTGLPVTHVLRKQYQLAGENSQAGKWVVEAKYKDTSGKTVATSKTVGNLTTHKDPEGHLLGYSIAVNGKVMNYDARGRAIK
jgi:hypothetical protein